MKNLHAPSFRRITLRILAAMALGLWAPAAIAAPLPGQSTLFPPAPSGGQGGTVSWEVTLEPASVAPGGEVSVIAKYDIASGWHIYAPDHDPDAGPGIPMELRVEAPGLTAIGKPTFPEPKIKREPTLNWVHRILEGTGSITQRYKVISGASTGKLALNVTLKGQRCDPSICLDVSYKKTLELTIADAPAAPAASGGETKTSSRPPARNLLAGGNSGGGSLLGDTSPGGGNLLAGGDSSSVRPGGKTVASHAKWDFTLESDEADRGGKVTVLAKYKVDPGWHIYAPDQGGFSMPTVIDSPSEHLKLLGKPTFPAPKIGRLPGLDEEQRWLEGEGTIRQGFVLSPDAPTGALSLPVTVSFQTCTEETCELPEEKTVQLTVTVSARPPLDPAQAMSPAEEAFEPLVGGDDDLAEQPLWLFILAMIGGGLFALAMPCTYPMIPITISYFTKQAEARHGAVLPLALAYGAGIIVIFNVIGLLFATGIARFAAHPATNLVFCIAFVVFALSLFGLYEIRLPSSANLLTGKAASMGGYLGVFLLGTVLVITSFTCTAPVMGGLLAIAVSDDGGIGRVCLGMTVFGSTIGVPFVLLSMFPARVKSLPSSGEWMHVLKVSLGYLELAAALKFLSNVDLTLEWKVLPRELFLLLWGGIFLMGSLYILNVYRLQGDSKASIGPRRMLTGLCTLLLGIYFLWGSFGYQLDWVTSALAPPYSAERVAGAAAVGRGKKGPEVSRTLIVDDIDGAVAAAKKEHKPILINFTGHT